MLTPPGARPKADFLKEQNIAAVADFSEEQRRAEIVNSLFPVHEMKNRPANSIYGVLVGSAHETNG